MSYTDNLEKYDVELNALAVIRPKKNIQVDEWITYSDPPGDPLIKYINFDSGYVTGFSIAEKASQITVSYSVVYEWGDLDTLPFGTAYYDQANKRIYFNVSALNMDNYIWWTTFEIYLSTTSVILPRDPLDENSENVCYDPFLMSVPAKAITTGDAIFGYFPIVSSSLRCQNANGFFDAIIYDCTFKDIDLEIYHMVGEHLVENVKLLLDAKTLSVDFTDNNLNFRVTDKSDVLDSSYFYSASEGTFYNSTSDVAPAYRGKMINMIFGKKEGVLGVNIDYLEENPTTSDNRDYVFNMNMHGYTLSKTANIFTSAYSGSTTTRTYYTSSTGLVGVGDKVTILRNSGAFTGTYEYINVTAVGVAAQNYFEHAPIANGAINSGDTIWRAAINNVILVKDSVPYQLWETLHYTATSVFSGNKRGITLKSTVEASLGIGTIQSYDLIYSTVYGQSIDDTANNALVTLDGTDVGANSDTLGSVLSNPITILVHILKNVLGISESQIDTTTFLNYANSVVTDEIGLQIPFKTGAYQPTCKQVINKILESILGIMYINDDGKWSLYITDVFQTPSKTIQEYDIVESRYNYSVDYNDIYHKTNVNYNEREVQKNHAIGTTFENVTKSSATALRFNNVTKSKDFSSLLFIESQAETVANKLSSIVSDRKGSLAIDVKNNYYDLNIGDTVTIEKTRLIGYPVDLDNLKSRNFIVKGYNITHTGVRLTLDDQKAIQDNEGDW